MPNTVVVPLIITAGVLTICGTATVAVNYAAGARLGGELLAQLESEAKWAAANPVLALLENQVAGEIYIGNVVQRLAHLRTLVATYLRPRGLLVGGLICYFLAAILDTVAGVGALLR